MVNIALAINLEMIDRNVSLAINSLHCGLSDSFWLLMSARELWYPLYAVLAGVIIWRLGWKRGLVMLGAVILSIVCIDQCGNIVKELCHRLRPCNDPYMTSRGLHMLEGISKGHCYGFFSAHAANTAGLVTAAYMSLRMDRSLKWKGFLIGGGIWSLLVGFSRIFVAKHFLGDVITGLVAGILIAWLIAMAGRHFARKV